MPRCAGRNKHGARSESPWSVPQLRLSRVAFAESPRFSHEQTHTAVGAFGNRNGRDCFIDPRASILALKLCGQKCAPIVSVAHWWKGWCCNDLRFAPGDKIPPLCPRKPIFAHRDKSQTIVGE